MADSARDRRETCPPKLSRGQSAQVWRGAEFALEIASREDFKTAVAFSHWIDVEHHLEDAYAELEKSSFPIYFKKTQLLPDGPKAVSSRPHLTVIGPWTDNRIVLTEDGTHDPHDPAPDYVNASPMPHDFAACGMPQNDHTRADFWRMCMETRATLIVMLNLADEQDNIPYWPFEQSSNGTFKDVENKSTRYGNVLVTLTSVHRSRYANRVSRKFKLVWSPVKESPAFPKKAAAAGAAAESETAKAPEALAPPRRSADGLEIPSVWEVEHLQYLEWPDMGVPSEKDTFIAFLQMTLRRKKLLGGPVFVHCFGGAGRTGTFLAVALQLIQLDSWKRRKFGRVPQFDDLLLAMRKGRPNQIQTPEQYKFAHRIMWGFVFPREPESTSEE
mmetsp:Transcript_22571/g.56633  ORF Transcript_22571/g.56633 Transcript_22571/m.56633 type:complete len:387 (-) Transcript_22571:59-1219(-)|eukprot:CAMPEP_0177639944 /NCGR_PEP_ID=MMETSP0447-20121125/6285_1 /TAXON_ID=0 /ORGANISM="Stygamoeba regulata, Strain BSH-02190019" /LENGTH=386 /DNA_ID=CAMNT_0019141993 /DNA_START=27 /DNA_END=1187 /DNA_ORIENTATION=-